MRSWAAVAVFFACASFARAQVGEFSLSGGVSRFGNANLGTSADASGNTVNNTINNGFRLTFRFTLNTYRFAGHEFGYAYNRSGVQLGPSQTVSMSIQQGFYDFLLYATPEGSRIRPFVAGGVEFSSFFPPGTSVYYGNQETKFGINYGAGIKMRVTSVIGLRVDFREYNTGKPFKFTNEHGRLNQLEASVGASFLF
jgi:hypothetical protein